MDIQQVEIMVLALMDLHSLAEQGWTFVWDNSRRRFGQCRYSKKEIGLSLPLTQVNEEDEVRDVILHEIAHQIAYVRYNEKRHGRLWKKICLEIGAKPERCYGEEVTRNPKYILMCPKCKKIFKLNRLQSNRTYYHCGSLENKLIVLNG